MSLPSQALDLLTKAGPINDAILALSPVIGKFAEHLPLVGKVADYIDGADVAFPPELPTELKSDIELRRVRALAAKAE